MGKPKYTADGGLKTEDGGRKQRDHTKSGKKAQRKEVRRLEAIARQTRRVKTFEEKLAKAKKKADAQLTLDHAELTLAKIRGGTPHGILEKQTV